jgi:hypothetical protein
MSVMLDLIMSSFLGGVITMIILNANFVIKDTWARFNNDYIVQQMLISNAQIVECEFRNMGCGLDVTQNSIITAMDTCIEFQMALRPEPDYPISRIKYYTGPTSELASTENPKDKFLYRRQDGGAPQRVGLVSQFSLRYFNFAGDSIETPISDPDTLGTIRIIELTMEVQSPFASTIDPDGKRNFELALWKQTRLASQNLNR